MLKVAAALTFAAALLVVRPLVATGTFGERLRTPRWSIAALLVLACAAGAVQLRTDLLERRLSRAASTLAGFPVQVHCQGIGESTVSLGSELGYVRWGPDGIPERRTVLDRSVCRSLRGLPGSASSQVGVVAVHILTHEAMHMRGEKNEARTECQAVQRDVQMGQALGLDQPQARALSRAYWDGEYARLPEQYRSAECRDGGQLDEDLPEAPWESAAPG